MKHALRGRYQIERPLGAGGMGTVVAARDLRTGQAVAIKWLGEPGSSPGDKELARFEQEARIAGSLASAHITRVLEIARDPETGVPYLVMEQLAGEDLQALLDRLGPLDAGAAVQIARQACLGLSEAHAAGVVHRDVKPSNLFLSRGEGGEIVVKILDFGIAKIRRSPGAAGASRVVPAPPVSVTRSGEMLGSPLYMSPEQIEASRHVDARSDVFSMGVTLYAMLAGRAPYAHLRSFAQLLYTVLHTPAPPLQKAAPWAPGEVAAIVDRAMDHAIDARFPDAAAMLTALRACAPQGEDLREEGLVAADRAQRPPAAADPAAATVAPAVERTLWQRLVGTRR